MSHNTAMGRFFFLARVFSAVVLAVMSGVSRRAHANAPEGTDSPLQYVETSCIDLRFVPIAPIKNPLPPRTFSCNPQINKLGCLLEGGYSHFLQTRDDRDGPILDNGVQDIYRNTYHIQRVLLAPETEYNRLRLMVSPIVSLINQFRILGRTMAHAPDPCEANYTYLSPQKVFGFGPAFTGDTDFEIGASSGPHTTNVLFLDEQSLLPKAVFDQQSLIDHSYFEVTVAHELAHGLMSDLYGLDGFRKLMLATHSHAGHFASIVSDPVMAWFEGFAEGFEAYAGEQLTPAERATPLIDRQMDLIIGRLQAIQSGGGLERTRAFWRSVGSAISTVKNIGSLMVEFLKSERQQSVRENHYVIQGIYANIFHRYPDLIPALGAEIDQDGMANWTPEPQQIIYNKEGAIAHLVYGILKLKLHAEMFAVLIRTQPANVQEFLQAFIPALNAAQLLRVRPLLASVFTPAGRQIVADYLHDFPAGALPPPPFLDPKSREALAKIPLEALAEPAQELWVEFSNSHLEHWLGHSLMLGTLDRLNLAAATATRFQEFMQESGITGREPLATAKREALDDFWLDQDIPGSALSAFIRVRDSHPATTQAFANGLYREAARMMKIPVLRFGGQQLGEAARKVEEGAHCYETKCISSRAFFPAAP